MLGRNFKTKWGELDIVAKKKGVIVFVEVKTLRQKSGFFPEDAVDYKKRKQLLKMRQIYLSRNKLSLDTASQIDILAVEADNQGNVLDIRHWENAIEDVC
ncbi:MAG: YraN family protein [Patescibacteria group bacterium]|nr:YraN family protein [Patescibacteria group bacterium]